MARKRINNLDTLIPAYAENKAMLDDYKKICDKENKQIKELMDEGSYEAGGYKATKSVQVRESMNEDKLLEILKDLDDNYDIDCYGTNLIKTKEYVDMDVLESLIYKGKLSNEVLMDIDKCRESKEVVTLRISKVKENK